MIMQEVKDYLLNHQDIKYREFSQNLNICSEYKSIGVRLPIIRLFAKTLCKKYSLDYLIREIDEEYYEEIILKGFIIGNYKNITYKELINYINNHLTKIKDWSMCDSFVTSLKITKKYHDELWDYLNKLLNSKEEFIVRFSIVMMLNYYICDEYKNRIYDVIKSIKSDSYYVNMANAWLLSYMFIKYYDDTIYFVKNNNISEFVTIKGITKAIESYRISEIQKNKLRELRNDVKVND